MSGGEKKRVTTGEILVGGARVLLMDEISTGPCSRVTGVRPCARQLSVTVPLSSRQTGRGVCGTENLGGQSMRPVPCEDRFGSRNGSLLLDLTADDGGCCNKREHPAVTEQTASPVRLCTQSSHATVSMACTARIFNLQTPHMLCQLGYPSLNRGPMYRSNLGYNPDLSLNPDYGPALHIAAA